MSKVECDVSRCSGCLACIVACIDQHYDETDSEAVSPRIYEIRKFAHSGLMLYSTRSCLHCEDAACISACRFGALVRDERNFVIPVREKCTGCRMCQKACPHDVPRLDQSGKIVKCDGCSVRVATGLEPACVRACNTGALAVTD